MKQTVISVVNVITNLFIQVVKRTTNRSPMINLMLLSFNETTIAITSETEDVQKVINICTIHLWIKHLTRITEILLIT
jgi:hypothetical protein